MSDKKTEKPEKQSAAESRASMKTIVRIAGKDLNGDLPIYGALHAIKGIGQRTARNMAIAFEKATGKSFDTKLGELPEDLNRKLEEVVLNPANYGLPLWSLNRRKDFETGLNSHLIMSDLDFAQRKDFQRLNDIKSYRGLRLSWGLTVRGQRTKSTHRGKGPVVGVLKKEARKAMAPAKKGEEKKK